MTIVKLSHLYDNESEWALPVIKGITVEAGSPIPTFLAPEKLYAATCILPNKNREAPTIRHTIWKILLPKIDWAYNPAQPSEFQLGLVDESPLPIVKIDRRIMISVYHV
eukprot:COSAG01_NODE_2517_length_7524_cov_19.201616_4_plen_109_part_00